jgi:Voltage-dependent anion channel
VVRSFAASIGLINVNDGIETYCCRDQVSFAARDTNQWYRSRTIRLQMSSDGYLDRGWRRAVRNFTPSWFTVTMGTGIVSILLYELPYNGKWLYWLSVITFCLNICLFLCASLVSLLRYIVWPEMWTAMISHPSQSLFLAAVPMVSRSHIAPSPPSTEDTGTRHDHPDAHIHLCSTLGQLGGLYCLGVSSHSSNVFDAIVKQTY